MAQFEQNFDITLKGGPHRLTVRHEDRPCDAILELDGAAAATKIRLMPKNGSVHFMDYQGQWLIVTILRNENDTAWDYDCFIDGKSIRTGMPWMLHRGVDYASVVKWLSNRPQSKAAYIAAQTLKGALLGVCVFVLVVLVSLLFDIVDLNNWWMYLSACTVPLAALYWLFAPVEWKNNQTACEAYHAFAAGDSTPAQAAQPDEPVQSGQPNEPTEQPPSADNTQEESSATLANDQ